MTRVPAASLPATLVLALAGVTLLPPATAAPAPPLAAGAETEHSLDVSGTGLGMYPAFAEGTTRYAVTNQAASDGTMSIAATTSDPSGLVRIDGRPVASDTTTTVVEGLTSGQEVSVIISDSEGTAAYSLFYLPTDFPRMERTTAEAGRAPGHVFMTLSPLFGSRQFETITDDSGVPIYASEQTNPQDMKPQPNGSYSVTRGDSGDLFSSFQVVELDSSFQEINRFRTVGLANTDFHESILLPNGNRILMAYEPDLDKLPDRVTDSIAQEINPAGEVVFSWNSRDHVRLDPQNPESVTQGADYAHLNSIDVMADGDWLMSFRHLSAVFKVARTAHDGFAPGDVVWRLGGKRSDFTFPDDPYAGPCAQHTAREMADGNILIFDNGSQTEMCTNPADLDGPRIERVQSRAVEYQIEPPPAEGETGEASIAFEWMRDGAFYQFAGSTERQANGNTLLGTRTSIEEVSDAVEVDAAGTVVWELTAENASSYRVYKAEAPDVIEPRVTVGSPQAGATFIRGESVVVDYGCSDQGGSTLQSCGGTTLPGDMLDTATAGNHLLTVAATDGAGNRTTVTRRYSVSPPLRPDLSARKRGATRWVGDGIYSARPGQTLSHVLRRRAPLTVQLRLQNEGPQTGALQLRANQVARPFRVRWFVGARQVTNRVVAGTFRSPRLAPGKSLYLRAVVSRVDDSRPRAQARIRLVAAVAGSPEKDGVRIDLKRPRR